MKNTLLCLIAVFGLFVSSAAFSQSEWREERRWVRQNAPDFFAEQRQLRRTSDINGREFRQNIRGYYAGRHAVPEIDAAGAALALALLGGIVSIAREKRKRGV